MTEQRIISFLGLAIRAGKVCKGESICERAIRDNLAELVIVAGDASANTKKRFSDKCKFYETEYREFSTKEQLGKLTRSENRAVLTVNDKSMTNKLLKMIESELNGGAELG